MPIKTPHTKAERAAVVKTEMHKFGQGDLHSGNKSGPVVTNPKQAIAISLSEARPKHQHKMSGHAGAHMVGKR